MIREATQADALALAELAIKMWSNNTISGLQSEFLGILEEMYNPDFNTAAHDLIPPNSVKLKLPQFKAVFCINEE